MSTRPLLTSVFVLGGLAAAGPFLYENYLSARETAERKACFANQKTLAGAMEMYVLDH